LERFRHEEPHLDVLIVDDDAGNRRALREMLEAEGFGVTEAENGRLALERMAQARPSAILLDLVMPEMDGFAFVRALRERAEWREIPVVVLTAKDITRKDRLRLEGYVTRVIQKDEHGSEALFGEIGDLIRTCVNGRSG